MTKRARPRAAFTPRGNRSVRRLRGEDEGPESAAASEAVKIPIERTRKAPCAGCQLRAWNGHSPSTSARAGWRSAWAVARAGLAARLWASVSPMPERSPSPASRQPATWSSAFGSCRRLTTLSSSPRASLAAAVCDAGDTLAFALALRDPSTRAAGVRGIGRRRCGHRAGAWLAPPCRLPPPIRLPPNHPLPPDPLLPLVPSPQNCHSPP